jgi:hypothetical protein
VLSSAGGTVDRFEKYVSIGTRSEVDLVGFCIVEQLLPQWLWGNPHLAPHLISLGVWLRASELKLVGSLPGCPATFISSSLNRQYPHSSNLRAAFLGHMQ